MGLSDGTVIFTVGEQRFDWADVKAAAVRWGDWETVEARVREGLAALQFLDADENDIRPAELEAAMDAFREERNLLAAEEMTAWLEERGLDVDAWIGFVERGLARPRCTDQLDEIVASYPVDDDAVAEAVECEILCSGIAATMAKRLAAAAAFAAARGTGAGPGEPSGAARIESLVDAFVALRAEAVTPEAIARILEVHRLDWTVIDCGVASFESEDAAREALLCVSMEGETLSAVARSAGVKMEESSFLLQDLDADLQTGLLSTEPGSLLGPLPFAGRPTLLLVVAKRSPDAADERMLELAERALVAAAIEREAGAARFGPVP